jgi:hypothetical protein
MSEEHADHSAQDNGRPGCLVFVDESGDPGMKLDGGSSEFFTVTLLLFVSPDDARSAELSIRRLRGELGVDDRFEFHFARLKSEWRKRFFQAIRDCPCFYFAMAIRKRRVSGPGFNSPDSFYKFTCKLAFENAQSFLRQATVIVDGSGDRRFRAQLKKYLCARALDSDGNQAVRKLKTSDSKRDDLLQMADMFCGAVARSLDRSKTDRNDFRRLIAHREQSFRCWPS